MPRPQIKRTISSNFAVSKILDIVRAPYDIKTFCSSSHKSNWHRTAVSSEMPSVHFSFQKDTGRPPAGHLAATRRRPDGARTNTCQTSCPRPAAAQFMLSLASNHSLKSDISVESLRILNNASQRERRKTHKEAAILPSYTSGSQENGVIHVGEKFSAIGYLILFQTTNQV